MNEGTRKCCLLFKTARRYFISSDCQNRPPHQNQKHLTIPEKGVHRFPGVRWVWPSWTSSNQWPGFVFGSDLMHGDDECNCITTSRQDIEHGASKPANQLDVCLMH